MLKNKEIENKFGIATKTLYNWSKSRPDLYDFLKRADDFYDKTRDLNIILRAYEHEIEPSFTKSEIEFLVALEYKKKATENFENFPQKFLELCKRKITNNEKIIATILPKITKLSLIESYILLDKIDTYQEKLKSKEIDLKEYFRHIFQAFYLS